MVDRMRIAIANSLVIFVARSYLSFYCVVQSLLFLYKGLYLADRLWIYVFEIILFIGLAASECFLLQLAASRSAISRKTQFLSLPLYFVTAFLVTYFVWWQQYVLFAEVIFACFFLTIKAIVAIVLLTTAIVSRSH